MVWHFDLKENVTFSDGSAMTAADVTASLNAARSSAEVIGLPKFSCEMS